MSRRILVALVLPVFLIVTSVSWWTLRGSPATEKSRFLRSRDMFPSLDDPPALSAAEARFLRDTDEVLGFVVDGHARAYPVDVLAHHHVVNDVVGGRPLLVTY